MIKERGSTKQRIIQEAMKLFSINGYEAVSIREIASAVGIGNSALYKHFKCKQEIFDSIVIQSKERYIQTCNNAVTVELRGLEDVKKICKDMYHYQTSDEWIVMFRKMLILEQFKNQQMAALYKEFFIDIPIQKQEQIFQTLISQGLMKDTDVEVVAMELYAPFFMYHTITCDSDKLIKRFDKHIEYFFENNIIREDSKYADK